MSAQPPEDRLPVSSDSPPPSVPTFGCIVYVLRQPGGVRVRVANLAGLEETGADERAALGKLVPAFKKHVSELMQAEQEIPWIDPPVEPEPDEQKRFIPVHL